MKQLLFSIIIVLVGIATTLISCFVFQPLNEVAFIIFLIFGCFMMFFGFALFIYNLNDY